MSFGETFTAFGSLGDAYRQSKQRDALGALGAQIQGGDYAGAAKAAFEAGDPGTGLGLLKLGEVAKTRLAEEAAGRSFANGVSAMFGGGQGGSVGQVSDASAPGTAGASPRPPAFAGGVSPMRMPGSGGENETKFVDALKAGGLTNPYGLGAMAAYANHESRYSNNNINGSWSDPSESGAPGTSGGILSWRGDRLSSMQRATAGAPDPVVAQAKYALVENPDLTLALQRAKSPEEANALMARAWKFAGWDRSGGENAARLSSTRAYVTKLNATGGLPTVRTAQAAPAPGPVAYADDEAQTQALERQMNMMPPSRQVASADPQADLPAPGAREAAFVIPPGSAVANPAPGLSGAGTASARPVPVMQMPDGGSAPSQNAAPQIPPDATVGNRPASAIQGTPLGQRIPFLAQALSSPYIKGGQRELASLLFRQALDETKAPEGVKEYMWAKAHGMTQAASPNEYAREKQRNPGEDLSSQIQARRTAAEQYGLQPGTPEYRSFILTGKEQTERDEGAKLNSQIEARRAQAPSLGLEEGTPAWRSFVATGKLGPDRDLSPGDRKSVDAADDAALAARTSIRLLEQAKELSKQAYGGPFASERGRFMNVFGGERGQATQELDNVVTTNALTNLKSIFGGNPTEGERKILLEVQGSSNMPHETRVKIYQRAIDAAQERMEQRLDRAAQIREGTYYRPGSGPMRNGADGSRQPAARQDTPAPQGSPGDRFGQLIGSGMTKAQAYEQMHREGF